MAISKEKKEELVAQYTELLQRSQGVVLTENHGLSVPQIQDLRNRVREAEGAYHVAKNTLTKLALKNASLSVPDEVLLGPTVIGFAFESMPGLAKAIVDFAKENDRLTIKGGLLGEKFLSDADVQALADLPPLPVMRAQLLGLISAPATRIAGALGGSVRQLVNVFNAYAEKDGAEAAA
ncbi:MAG: 50S ribosomal protein L10 [Anaerolineales bacterium]